MASIHSRIADYTISYAPWGCGDGRCDLIVNESDYASERQSWIDSCVASNKKFLESRNKVRGICQSNFDNVTQSMRYGTHEENYTKTADLYNINFSQNNQNYLYIILIIVIGMIAYAVL